MPRKKYAASRKTPKEVVRLKVLAAEARRAGDAHGAAQVEQAIRDLYDWADRRAAMRSRKGKTLAVLKTIVF